MKMAGMIVFPDMPPQDLPTCPMCVPHSTVKLNIEQRFIDLKTDDEMGTVSWTEKCRCPQCGHLYLYEVEYETPVYTLYGQELED